MVSTELPDESKRRLTIVMQQLGYDGSDAVDATVSRLAHGNLEAALSTAGLHPPLTFKEMTTLLLKPEPPGAHLLMESKAGWIAVHCKEELPIRVTVYGREQVPLAAAMTWLQSSMPASRGQVSDVYGLGLHSP